MLIKERFVTYYQGVLSPELGSPRTHGRAVPRVVTKSAKLHELLPDLAGRISMRVISKSTNWNEELINGYFRTI